MSLGHVVIRYGESFLFLLHSKEKIISGGKGCDNSGSRNLFTLQFGGKMDNLHSLELDQEDKS